MENVEKHIKNIKSGLVNMRQAISDYNNDIDIMEFSTDKLCAEIESEAFDFDVSIEKETVEQITCLVEYDFLKSCEINVSTSSVLEYIQNETGSTQSEAEKIVWNAEYRDSLYQILKEVITKEY